ncbi:16S rRNA (uracil(1498)-N(3))-methyltransferase [Acidaminococcus fermentans]|uniref:16S rRNA (uracil(1498)-N(3))-methyltransferase n=2 Tax=Acidaminococcus fermentans TaxID=905 RepID=UPI00242AB55A|nr:16S rRNA (uracil(1498)-N(3))-methyltransferase [Acidaminococcus fermentans]
MYRFFVPRDFGETMSIDGQDSHHITHVLRMKLGEQLQIVSLDQVAAVMKITGFGENRVDLSLVETLAKSHEPSVKVTLIQGLPKQDKLEWVIQKAIELGVTEIRPVIMDHSVVKVDPAKAAKKQERWQKIAEAAAKQSKRDIIPQVALPAKFRDIVTQCPAELKIVAYEVEDTRGIREVLAAHRDARSIAFLIGPEGGISKDEFALTQELGWHSVSLGPRIMRTETAALATLTAIMYETGNLGG